MRKDKKSKTYKIPKLGTKPLITRRKRLRQTTDVL